MNSDLPGHQSSKLKQACGQKCTQVQGQSTILLCSLRKLVEVRALEVRSSGGTQYAQSKDQASRLDKRCLELQVSTS